MEPPIELHLLSNRLKIISVPKNVIHKFVYSIVKIAFTSKTNCSFFSFTETSEDYTLVVDNYGFTELEAYIDDTDGLHYTESYWIPMYLCGEDLPGQSISKIAKYIILPLADWKISIMAISMYQCDYILIQEKDYDAVVSCLSAHIPKIFDESLTENEMVFMRAKGKSYFLNKNLPILNSIQNGSSHCTNGFRDNKNITLPVVISDESEYCITGLYNQDTFLLIIPTLLDIMFYETVYYKEEEIFFNFTKKDMDISIVIETKLLKKFPPGTLLNIESDYWKLIRIGRSSVGLEIFGVCASVSSPLIKANIDEYYISSFHTGYCFIPSEKLDKAKDLFSKQKSIVVGSNVTNNDDSQTSKSENSLECNEELA